VVEWFGNALPHRLDAVISVPYSPVEKPAARSTLQSGVFRSPWVSVASREDYVKRMS
jgi:hypothetical protein